MRKFDFRLEPVLKYREIIEEQAAAKQAKAREEFRHNQEFLCEARDKLADSMQGDQPLNPFDMFNRLAYCDYMAGEVKRREKALHLSEKKLEKCRQNLVRAMQDRSVLEKLRNKQLDRYNLFISSTEQKETDEIALRQFNPGKDRY